jgi:septal ring factor EnvC (AmiA/AmiB activator)
VSKGLINFVCLLCIFQGSDTASQSSETSEILEEDSIRSLLAKMNKKLQSLDEIKDSCAFLSAKYDDIDKHQEEQAKLINELTSKVDRLSTELASRDRTISNLTDRISEL